MNLLQGERLRKLNEVAIAQIRALIDRGEDEESKSMIQFLYGRNKIRN